METRGFPYSKAGFVRDVQSFPSGARARVSGYIRTIGISPGERDDPRLHARRTRAAFAVLAMLCACCAFAACRGERSGEEAFVSDRNVTLWSSLAQVRQPVTVVHYGDRVEIMDRQGEQARVRDAAGLLGWTDQRNLMDSALWHRARTLSDNSTSMPIQARAVAERLTNLHIEPGRATPRTYQLRGGTKLEVLGRAVADFAKGGTDADAKGDAVPPAETRREDWSLVSAHEEPAGTIAGWVLRRFIRYDVPPELADYSSQYRFVAWFQLSEVPVGEATAPKVATGEPARKRDAPGPPDSVSTAAQPSESGEKPQFLVAGIQGPDGQACDFTLIRVYTWGAQRHRYETAYVESNLCGSLPIRVQAASAAGGNAGFGFKNEGRAGEEHREYTMHQTSVRRVDNRRAPAPGHAAHRPH